MLPGNELICKFTERNNIRHESGRYGVLQSPLSRFKKFTNVRVHILYICMFSLLSLVFRTMH
jgi:hypothetical protein